MSFSTNQHGPQKAIALCVGDPSGIGPEITVKLLNQPEVWKTGPLWIVGSYRALEKAAQQCGLPLPSESDSLHYWDIPGLANTPAECGELAYQGILEAVMLVAHTVVSGIVTGPISKANLWAAGHRYGGHTELLETLSQAFFPEQAASAEMLFLYKQYRTILLTRHIPLREVSHRLTAQSAEQTIRTFAHCLKQGLDIQQPRLAIMGVNPHAEEIGGEEERHILRPAMEAINASGLAQCEGPFAADALMRGVSVEFPTYDGYVATYHDQGLIPVKLLGGLEAVNVTIGLPFLRTSVSHGMASDIVGQNKADARSLVASIEAFQQLAFKPKRPTTTPKAEPETQQPTR